MVLSCNESNVHRLFCRLVFFYLKYINWIPTRYSNLHVPLKLWDKLCGVPLWEFTMNRITASRFVSLFLKTRIHFKSLLSHVAIDFHSHVYNEKPEELKIDHHQALLLSMDQEELINASFIVPSKYSWHCRLVYIH